MLSLGDALAFQAALGEDRKVSRYQEVFESFQRMVDASPHVAWRSPRSWDMGGILTAIGLQNGGASAVSQSLFQDHGIVLRPFPQAGLNSLRVSPNLMNTEEELTRLLSILERA